MKTKIEWTDYSWNPIRAKHLETGKTGHHCEHASEGCRNCYAEGINKRLGTRLPFKPGHRKDIELFLDENMLTAPLRWKRPRMVFVCSMTDLFAEFVPDEWIDKIFVVMALAPQHTFQVLTKRAERMRDYLSAVCDTFHASAEQMDARFANIWLGVSAERQQEADERIPLLLQTPAAMRFVSLEPLLGPIDLHSLQCRETGSCPTCPRCLGTLDWAIVGGESGPHARPMDLDWARSLVTQCRHAEIKCFVKQLGSRPILHGFTGMPLKHGKGGNLSEWPDDLRIREIPHET